LGLPLPPEFFQRQRLKFRSLRGFRTAQQGHNAGCRRWLTVGGLRSRSHPEIAPFWGGKVLLGLKKLVAITFSAPERHLSVRIALSVFSSPSFAPKKLPTAL
jgi:hypothetical protein